MLRFEDVVFGQDYYCRAAAGIIRIYLQLADNPTSNDSAEPDYSSMTAAERKKAKALARKKKKAEEKKEEQAKEEVSNGNGQAKGGAAGGKSGFVDEDPLGKQLLKLDPLAEARKYSAMLARYATKDIQTWLLQYDVAIRRKKALMALQALFKAKAIDPFNGGLFSRLVDFAGRKDKFDVSSDIVKKVLSEDAPNVMDNHPTVADFINAGVNRINNDPLVDLPYRVAVAKALVDTKAKPIGEAAAFVLNGGLDCRQVSVDTCQDALDTLATLEGGADVAQKWLAAVKERFPRSSIVLAK